MNNTKGGIHADASHQNAFKQNALKVEDQRNYHLEEFAHHNHQGAAFGRKAASPNPLSLQLERHCLFLPPFMSGDVGLGGRELPREIFEPYFFYFVTARSAVDFL